MALARFAGLSLALLALSATADADEDAKSASAAEAPKLSLSVRERGPRMPWQLTLMNESSGPITTVADPRLLWFDIEVPGKKKTERCRLPSDLLPKKSDRRTQVTLAAGEGLTHAFDPRLYCFAGGSGQWRLVPGALITPHYGWEEKVNVRWRSGKKMEQLAEQKPPFVAWADGKEDEAGVKAAHATTFALRSEYARWASTRLEEDRALKDRAPIGIKMAQGSDAAAERNATVAITLTNQGKTSEHLYFRRELVSFEIMGPDGLTQCDSQPDLRAPDRQAFLYLKPGGKITITSRLVELCPNATFARPGLYLVHARLDATVDGADFDLDAFTGRVVSELPATVRIRKGDLPYGMRRTMRRVRRAAADTKAP